ncbi:MAG: hypothetical protein EA402_08755 [Planctomycetota bacterium]|nr:MAG: hypothetical protein EA402_08755 [Planctomycetota bacterium]
MVAPSSAGQGSVAVADHPPLPFSQAAWQRFSTRAEQLGLGPCDGLRPGLEALHGHLVGVNAWMNLTRVAGEDEYLQRHVLDSLMLLREDCLAAKPPLSCCDLGSGGGYPGLPLALAAPPHRWLLVDSRSRKVRFLAAAASLVDSQRVRALAFRGREVAHQAPNERGAHDLVTSRATGAVDIIAAEALELLKPQGHLVVWQGPSFDAGEADRLATAIPQRWWSSLRVSTYHLGPDEPSRSLVILRRSARLLAG